MRGKVPEVLFDFSILTDPSEGADFGKIQNFTENSITLTLQSIMNVDSDRERECVFSHLFRSFTLNPGTPIRGHSRASFMEDKIKDSVLFS